MVIKTLAWDDAFTTGVASIDEQHHQLFNLVDELYHALKGEGDGKHQAEQRADHALPKIVLSRRIARRLAFSEMAHFSRTSFAIDIAERFRLAPGGDPRRKHQSPAYGYGI